VLPHAYWDFIAGGSKDELTTRRNRSAFDAMSLRPRFLRDVSERKLETTVLGTPISFPVMISPTGGHKLGIVNLLPIDMINRQEGGRLPESCPLCGGRKTREFLPGVESLLHFLTIDRRRQEVTSGPEVLRDGAIGCQKALGVPG
jgi:hypothetical protein